MVCPYSSNSFCSRLSPELKGMLCECCSKTHYPSGNVLSKHRWRDRFTLLLDGFIISVDPNANADGKFIPLELIGNGRFGEYLLLSDSGQRGRHLRQRPDRGAVQRQYRLCQGDVRWIHSRYNEMAMAFQEIGGGDALTKVKYLMRFCREHGIPQLTHAQIALATGLTRPTVTKTIHNLIKIQPELFLPRGDAP